MTAAPSRPADPDPDPDPIAPSPRGPAPPAPADRLLPCPPFPPPGRPRDARAVAARTWRRTWPWLAAVAAVVLVVITELGLLQGRIRADLARLRDAADVPEVVRTASAPPLPAIPVVAPAVAGDVAAVRLRLLDPPCAPAGTCRVLVAVDRTARSSPTPAPWTVLAIDRCRGSVVPIATGVVPAASGAYGVATVPVPAGRALALLAVTTGPARAASPALPIGSGPC
jgi:hypothetical protein